MDPLARKRKYAEDCYPQDKRPRIEYPDEVWDHILAHLDVISSYEATLTCKKWHEILDDQQSRAEDKLSRKIHGLINKLLSDNLTIDHKKILCSEFESDLKTVQHKIGYLKLTPEPIIRIGSRVTFRLAPLPLLKQFTTAVFSNLPYLQKIDLRNWSWVMKDPTSLSRLQSLRKIILPIRCWEKPYWNALKDTSQIREITIHRSGTPTLNGIHYMTQITHLNLIYCKISNKIIEKMVHLTALTNLDLSNSEIFRKENSFDSIELGYWEASDYDVHEIDQLSQLENLKKLTLSDTNMSSESLARFLSLTQIQNLTLRNLSTDMLTPKDLCHLSELRVLKLESLIFTEKTDLSPFANLKKLRKFSLKFSWWRSSE
nr:hypothetical protein [Chlamydiota bacterium]